MPCQGLIPIDCVSDLSTAGHYGRHGTSFPANWLAYLQGVPRMSQEEDQMQRHQPVQDLPTSEHSLCLSGLDSPSKEETPGEIGIGGVFAQWGHAGRVWGARILAWLCAAIVVGRPPQPQCELYHQQRFRHRHHVFLIGNPTVLWLDFPLRSYA